MLVKGGGKPFAALAVGSRAVGKRKTLDETMGASRNSKRIRLFACRRAVLFQIEGKSALRTDVARLTSRMQSTMISAGNSQ